MNCPNCDRLLYSRRHKSCGFCGKELPPVIQFSKAEITAIKAEYDAIDLRVANAKAKEKQQQQAQAASDAGYCNP